MRLDDVELQERVLHVREGKGMVVRSIALEKKAIQGRQRKPSHSLSDTYLSFAWQTPMMPEHCLW